MVAVIDDGVQGSLPDLAGRTVPGVDLTGGDSPYTSAGEPEDRRYGHGNDMAIKVAGSGAGGGLVGAAPGASVMSVKVPVGVADASYLARGISWATDHGADVISMSLGAPGGCPTSVQSAVQHAYSKGVILVAAAGNSGADVISSPANCIGVLAVSGVGPYEVPWQRGSTGIGVTLAGPAQGVPAEMLNGSVVYGDSRFDGTSTATAVVAGEVALLRSAYLDETARVLIGRVLASATTPVGPAHSRRYSDALGYGSVSVTGALAAQPSSLNPVYDEFDVGLRRLHLA